MRGGDKEEEIKVGREDIRKKIRGRKQRSREEKQETGEQGEERKDEREGE